MRDTIRCPRCEGSGCITTWNGSFKMSKVCSTCTGSGRIKNEKPKKLR